MDLTPEEVEQYRAGGYILEELKEGGEPDPSDKKTPIKSIFTDLRYKEYRKIKKENENIKELNKQIDLARKAYNRRWSVVDNYADSISWEKSPEYKGFKKYSDLVEKNPNKNMGKKWSKGPKNFTFKSYGNVDWEGNKKELIENYEKDLPRYSWSKEEYNDYLDWAEKKNPEYFKKYNIRERLKGLPIQNQIARSILYDVGPKPDEEVEEVIEKKQVQPIVDEINIEEVPLEKEGAYVERSLQQQEINELTKEKNGLRKLQLNYRMGLGKPLTPDQQARLDEIMAILQREAQADRDALDYSFYNQGGYVGGREKKYSGLSKFVKGGELPKHQVKGVVQTTEKVIPEVKNAINFLSKSSKEIGLLSTAIKTTPSILNNIGNILVNSNVNYKNPAELKIALDDITSKYFDINSKTFSFPKTDVSKDRIKSDYTFNISDAAARGEIKGNTDSRGIIKTPLTFKSFTPGGKIFNLATDKKGNIPTEQAFNILKKEKFGDIKFSRLENIIKSNFDGKIPSKINLNTLRNFTESSIRPFDLNVVDPKKSTIDASSDFGFEKLNYKNPEESKAVINSEREDEVLLDQIEYLEEQIANFDDLEAQGLLTYSDLRLMEKELDETQAVYDMKLELRNDEGAYNMENKTLLFTNKDLKMFADNKHASGTDDVLSHVHYTVRSDSPGTFTVTQFQSDAFQGGVKEWKKFQNTAIKQSEEEIEFYNNLKNAEQVPGSTDVVFINNKNGKKVTLTRDKQEEMLKNWEKNKERIDDRITTSKDLLSKEDDYKLYNQTWEPRILQETVDYAARNGQNTFRFPTQETTIKIQGYNDEVAKALTDKNHISKLSEYDQGNYYVTQRYQKSFPKLVEKIYGVKPKIVTDAQGNSWWEFRIPEGVIEGTQKIIAYKKGGSVGQQDLPKHQLTGIVKGGKDVIKYGDDIVKGAGNALKNLSKFTRSLRLAPGTNRMFPKLEISDRGYEHLPNRPFFEAYPITKSQKFKVKQQQEAAHQEGVDFVKNWYYKLDPSKTQAVGTSIGEDYTQNLRIRPEVQRRINVLIDQEKFADNPNQSMMIGKYYPHQSNFDFTISNPLRKTKNLLINTDWKNVRQNKDLTPINKFRLMETLRRWDDAKGVNLGAGNPSITFANKGRYYYRPETIRDISMHETGHTGQRLGYQFLNMPTKDWLDMVNKYDDVIDYEKASDHTPIGKRFKDAMVDKEWKGSVGELHAEMMVSRKKAYDQLVNQQGVSPKQAMDMLQNPNDDVIRFLMTQPASFSRTLHDFFKPGTTEKTKIDLLKLLPAGGIGIGIGTMNNDSKSKSKKLKEGGAFGPGDKYRIDILNLNPPKYQIIEKETGKSFGTYHDKVMAQAALEKLNGGPSIDIDPGFDSYLPNTNINSEFPNATPVPLPIYTPEENPERRKWREKYEKLLGKPLSKDPIYFAKGGELGPGRKKKGYRRIYEEDSGSTEFGKRKVVDVYRPNRGVSKTLKMENLLKMLQQRK